jgi:hypothetical protein
VAHLTQRRVRRPLPPPTDPNATHGNAAIYRRDCANLVAGDRKKKDTDALVIDEPNSIAAKMAAFDNFGTDEAKFWLTACRRPIQMARTTPNYENHTRMLCVRSMRGVIKFLGKCTELITDPTSSDATSTATTAANRNAPPRALWLCGCAGGRAGTTACGEWHDHRRPNDGIDCGIDGGARIRCDFDAHDGHPPIATRLARCGCGGRSTTACGEWHDHRRRNDGIDCGIDGGARIRCDFDAHDGCGWCC